MCVMPLVGEAPCQCFSPGGIHTTSPGRISHTGPPLVWARPTRGTAQCRSRSQRQATVSRAVERRQGQRRAPSIYVAVRFGPPDAVRFVHFYDGEFPDFKTFLHAMLVTGRCVWWHKGDKIVVSRKDYGDDDVVAARQAADTRYLFFDRCYIESAACG